jgi:ribosomal protein S18 acetylase RimI-like enzyme
MLWRIRPYAGVNIHFSKGSLVIGNVATFPEFRRKGVAASLLDDAIERGRREGYRKVQLSVLIGNDSARTVYERAGFEVTDEKRSRAFERAVGFPGYANMSLEL